MCGIFQKAIVSSLILGPPNIVFHLNLIQNENAAINALPSTSQLSPINPASHSQVYPLAVVVHWPLVHGLGSQGSGSSECEYMYGDEKHDI